VLSYCDAHATVHRLLVTFFYEALQADHAGAIKYVAHKRKISLLILEKTPSKNIIKTKLHLCLFEQSDTLISHATTTAITFTTSTNKH
jgi:hypothetical protein